MRVGTLNRRATIQRRAAGQDAAGQPVTTWTDVATVWADIRFRKGAEAIRADRDTAIAQASVRVRYRTDLGAGMRVLAGGTVYQVKAVLPDEQGREYVDLVCEVADA